MASALLKLTDVQIGQSLTATNNFTMYQPASPDGTVRWGVGNSGSVTDIITLTSSSQVGIGTTSPNTYSAKVAIVTDGSLPAGSAAIHIEGGSNNERINVRSTQAFNGAVVAIGSSGGTASARTVSTAGDLGYYFFSGYSGTAFSQQAGMVGYAGSTWSGSNYEAGVYFMTTPNGSTTRTERMRIDSSGNVGIGTSSPGGDANNRAVTASGSSSASFTSVCGSVSTNYASVSGNGLVGTSTNHALAFNTNNTERMRIDSSGNLLVGTTTASARFVVTASSNSTYAGQIRSDISGDVAQAPFLIAKYDNNSTTSQVFARFAINQGGTAAGQINANGASQAAFGSWSDARLKENIETLPPQLENICSLRPVEFDYIESEGGGHQIGFIAQEMQEVYPDAVGEREHDKMLTITGWSKTEARLVKAIQELKAELDATKAEVAALKGA